MLRLLTTNNVQVFRHLGAAGFQRADIDYQIASSYGEALELARNLKPQIALLDAKLAGGSGFALCREIKEDPALQDVHVVMLLSSVITRADLETIQQSRCDDILALPIHSDDFYHHIAQIAGLPFRRELRIGVSLEVLFPDLPGAISGMVTDVSASGMGANLHTPLEVGAEVVTRFRHSDQTYPDARARAVWVRPADRAGADEVYRVGFEFLHPLPVKTRILLERLGLYDMTPASEGPSPTTVSLRGDFTEITDFGPLAERLAGETAIDFNLAAVRYISSAGVRAWCQFLAKLEGKRYSFRHCSVAFASQAAMVPMVIGTGEVLSIEAPYRCEACDRDAIRLLETKSLLKEGNAITPPQLRCGSCGGPLEFDDIPERYFGFLRDPIT